MNKRYEIQNKINKKQESHKNKQKINYEHGVTDEDFSKESPPEDIIFPNDLNPHLGNQVQDSTSENGVLCRRLAEAEKKNNKQIAKHNSSVELLSSMSPNSNHNNKIKSLEDKLAQSNAKLYECKNKCMSLRQELNKAQKILCNEIGDNVTIASLSQNHTNGWKGRNEQIQKLQQKITELQKKFNTRGKSMSRSSSVSFEQKSVVSVERTKRCDMENLERKLREAEIASNDNRKKLETAKARIRVLENDLCLTRNNLIVTNDKKLNDEKLIEALNGQMRVIESRYRDKEIEIKNQRDKFQSNCVQLKNELATLKFQVEQLRKKLKDRETEINIIRSSKSEIIYESTSTDINQHNNPMYTIVDTQMTDANEYVILALTAEAERNKLLELVTTLNRRLENERADTDHVSELLRCERNKNLKLEKKLQQLEVERMKTSRSDSSYRAKLPKSLCSISSLKEQLNSEEMRYKVELLEEKCLALKTRLITVQQDKDIDLSIYKQMLENTKKIIQDTCRNTTPRPLGHSAVTI